MSIAANMNYFDSIGYVKKLRNAGVSQEVAEIQAQEMDNLVRNIATEIKVEIKEEIKSDELATKKDLEVVKLELDAKIETTKLELQKEIKESELKLQKEISSSRIQTLIWMGINTAFILGVIGKGFHWW